MLVRIVPTKPTKIKRYARNDDDEFIVVEIPAAEMEVETS
jgi:hypothetical protein